MYIYESKGIGNLKFEVMGSSGKYNGFAVGKRWAEVTVRMWKKDIACGLLFIHELYDIEKFPTWWLDEVLFKRK
jgi:hypothetical protein